jgi:lysophospholipase L1-like esterase
VALRRAAGEKAKRFLEIPELTESQEVTASLFGNEPIHPNVDGHRLMASRILSFLKSQGLLGDLAIPAE